MAQLEKSIDLINLFARWRNFHFVSSFAVSKKRIAQPPISTDEGEFSKLGRLRHSQLRTPPKRNALKPSYGVQMQINFGVGNDPFPLRLKGLDVIRG